MKRKANRRQQNTVSVTQRKIDKKLESVAETTDASKEISKKRDMLNKHVRGTALKEYKGRLQIFSIHLNQRKAQE